MKTVIEKSMGQAHHPVAIRATALLVLFLLLLISQGLHQLNNRALAAPDCKTTSHHLHQDPHAHHCDLCSFKVISFPQINSPIAFIGARADNCGLLTAQIIFRTFQQFPKRAPPAAG